MSKITISKNIDLIKYLRDDILYLEVKGFIAFLNDLADRDLDVTMDLLIELSGIAKSELTVLVEKCVELDIISYK